MKTRIPLILVGLALACFALVQNTQAVSPPPDGGYAGGNTAEGDLALGSLTTGIHNTGVGIYSLLSLTDGNYCTGVGAVTLLSNTGDENTATGAGALLSNTTGAFNTANGAFALVSNTMGINNTATGSQALYHNTIGDYNTAIGNSALGSNITGNFNTATGSQAVFTNTTGDSNTANGSLALFFNTTGAANTAIGTLALVHNTEGVENTAIGDDALVNNTTGTDNTAVGQGALTNNTTGNGNIALGVHAGLAVSTANNVIVIGALPGANLSNSCFIGNIFGGIIDPATATVVRVDSTGKLGTVASSRRFKHDIKPMDDASKAILALKPVTFHYKSDAKNTPCFGLVAEEVAEVNPDLVVRNENGEIYTVRYDAVNAMLLNEFLKEHRKVQEQEVTIAQLKKDFRATVAQLTTRLDEQAARIQKVSGQLEASKNTSQVVNNNQ